MVSIVSGSTPLAQVYPVARLATLREARLLFARSWWVHLSEGFGGSMEEHIKGVNGHF